MDEEAVEWVDFDDDDDDDDDDGDGEEEEEDDIMDSHDTCFILSLSLLSLSLALEGSYYYLQLNEKIDALLSCAKTMSMGAGSQYCGGSILLYQR